MNATFTYVYYAFILSEHVCDTYSFYQILKRLFKKKTNITKQPLFHLNLVYLEIDIRVYGYKAPFCNCIRLNNHSNRMDVIRAFDILVIENIHLDNTKYTIHNSDPINNKKAFIQLYVNLQSTKADISVLRDLNAADKN